LALSIPHVVNLGGPSMIADCERCNRKAVPCSVNAEGAPPICYRCQGDIDDPYCELEEATQTSPQAYREEILRLTGKDVGPEFWLDCPECGGEGSREEYEIVSRWSIDPPCGHVVTCTICNGAGGMICEAQ
jgi:hypothetical protein